MTLFAAPRRPRAEILDSENVRPEDAAESLADIRWINRHWGGYRTACAAVHSAIRPSPGARLSLLDLACGSADVAMAVAARARRRGFSIEVTALDAKLFHLGEARRVHRSRPPALLAADASALPIRDGSFDWVLSTLFFHHLSEDENVRVLSEMLRISRVGAIVVDLERHRLSGAFAAAVGPLFFRSAITRSDARTSVGQAYTAAEMTRIARAAGLGRFEVRRLFPFRLSLTAWC